MESSLSPDMRLTHNDSADKQQPARFAVEIAECLVLSVYIYIHAHQRSMFLCNFITKKLVAA